MRKLFDRKPKTLEPLWLEGELKELAVNYESVVDYLVGLSEKEFETIVEVADIHRRANAEEAKKLGIEVQPYTTIANEELELVPAHVNHPKPKSKKL